MTAPIPPGYPQPEPRTGPHWWERRWLQLTLAGLIIFIIGGVIGGTGNKGSTNTAATVLPTPDPATVTATMPVPGETATVSTTTTQTATATVTTTYTPVPVTAFPGDGEYLVGSDVQPGTYKSVGNDNCYADTEDQAGNVNAQELGAGQIILVVSARDYRVDVRGCAPFSRVR